MRRPVLTSRITAPRVLAWAVVFVACLAAGPAWSQCPPPPDTGAEFGDAPEGTLAYPDLGVAGLFPTCLGGPSTCIQHAFIPGGPLNNALFGPNLDYEFDGNAGVCPPPQYENDECYTPLDGDAGLVLPTSFTFGPTGPPFSAITCSGQLPQSLGRTCRRVQWGTDIDILITNNLHAADVPPSPQVVYFNVLIDFNRSGSWDPLIPACGPGIPEHVVQNLPVPIGFSGLASQLPIADFQAGADSGYVWARFSITPDPISTPWDGSGFFEGGETEDYMLHIDYEPILAEYGDAPQHVLAYPPSPVLGQFPTCTQTGAFVVHPGPSLLFFGTAVDYEGDGNANDCAFNVFDNDECFGGEAGLLVPRPYTIRRTPGPNIEPCTPPATELGAECTPIQWGAGLDIQITNNLPTDAFLNMLADWDQDGTWTSPPASCGGPMKIVEHVIENIVVPSGFSGLLSQLAPPQRYMGHRGYVWTRFTLGTAMAPVPWDGSGNMGEGETEDYLLLVGAGATDTEDFRLGALRVGEASPNPTRARTQVDLDLPRAARVEVSVYDARGQRVRDLGTQALARGANRIVWDGLAADGRRPAAGMYFLRFETGDQVITRRVLLLN